ncbi:hypothetical protein B0H16DRAFT_1514186 [Mycena metata]|uniref:Pyridoxal phosphate homeostasis protein n=1 Tax=Mycena metata TaxID=1033252 RepID=A0AAD7NR34_9AGAR|nr:hypothetical protein B0H16DRAFT_1514186 [Mycena metata]
MSSATTNELATRSTEILESLTEIRSRVASSSATSTTTLVAVSKFKPASDVKACFDHGQRDFGENYVQELEDKAKVLPSDIRWHFIGTLQSNKAKTLAAIPNLYSIQTLTSTKAATALNRSLPPNRTTPLNILIQINTSGEESKSGLAPLNASSAEVGQAEATKLARHIITQCPRLRFQGLMTIGALERSLSVGGENDENADFECLKGTRDVLAKALGAEFEAEKWGEEGTGRLLLSMGMSSDFEAALKAGSDIVRVGTGIFGARAKKVAS